MGRPVMLGNGQLTVGLNEYGMVHDFYYPYVGLDNLSTSRSVQHKIGVWIDSKFSWVGSKDWEISVDFETDALVSNITMRNATLNVELHLNDFVDSDYNALGRRVTVTNLAGDHRDIRLFMHQVFQISRAGRADTALYVPDDHYILDYKGRCSLLIYGESADGVPYDQYSIGNYGIEGKEGTFVDAEDGELSNNPVEHGGVDTVLRFVCGLAAEASTTIDYWIIASDTQYGAEKIHHLFKEEGLETRLAATRDYWREWLGIGKERLEKIDEQYRTMAKKSLMVIKAHTDKRGGIIASCDSTIYNYGRDYYSYVWPRDGAYAMWPLIRLGYTEEPQAFFEFCRDILAHEGYLRHKYQPDRSIGSTWHPLVHNNRRELAIQEDETAVVIYMLGEYHNQTGDDTFVLSLYNTLIQPSGNFMAEFIDDATGLPHASYDLWEEKFLTHTYTTACVYEALQVAADFADKFEFPDDAVKWRKTAKSIRENSDAFFDAQRGTYRKGFLLQEDGSLSFDNTLDVSSMYGVMMFTGKDWGVNKTLKTVQAIEQILLDQSPSGGAPRYEKDDYFASEPQLMGNPWFVTTLWLAQYYARVHQLDKARHYLEWTMDKALPSGVLSEQINPSTGEPLSVAPLVWSHSEFINTALDVSRPDPTESPKAEPPVAAPEKMTKKVIIV
jgi:GH15 family glucan-1,4-alpha-glucosidase